MNEIIRSFDASVDILEGERAVIARINSAAVDRLRTVIDPMGCDVKHFNRTRSVLWQHGLDPIRGTVPIGEGWAKVRGAENDIIGKCRFAGDAFSQQLYDAYKEKTIRGWSIKAGVHEATPPTRAEIQRNPSWSDCEMVYRKWDLLEFSGTPTPGNSDCLTMLVSRGLITAPEGFVAAEFNPPEKPLEPPQEERALPCVEREGDLWIVRRADGSGIPFPSESIARECLTLMGGGKSLESQMVGVLGEMRSFNATLKDDAIACIDLWRHGRV